MMKKLPLTWLLPVLAGSLALGAGLATIQSAPFSMGWIGTSVLLMVGTTGLLAAVRRAGGGKTLVWMTGLALILRIATGVAVFLALPINGYDEPDDRAGYVFTDAHRRDDQAWELASSGKPVWSAFDRSYYTDQYGGLLALSALSYRVFSPDSHRPLLIVTLAALAAALGVPFFFSAARVLGDERLAGAASWLYVLYPESVLTGGAQMREPFLLTFIAIALWGLVQWIGGMERWGPLWLGIGFLGMLLVSPAIAVVTLVLFGIWLLLRAESVRVRWPVPAIGLSVLVVGVAFLTWSLAARSQADVSPIGIVVGWFRDSVSWVIYQLERGSGQIQNVFSKLNPVLQFLFVVGYGVTQPVLPPAFLEPTTLTWHAIAIARSVGWYLVLPLLIYAPVSLRRLLDVPQRRIWTFLWIFSWIWIVICAIRAGGDQWDNPRYRLIFFGFQALVAAFAWLSWRNARDPWLPRILAAEVLCLVIFGQWYLARYYLIGIHFPIMVVLGMSMMVVVVIFVGGGVWDRLQARR